MEKRQKVFLWSFFISILFTVILGRLFFLYASQLKVEKEIEKINEQLGLFSEMGRVFFIKNKENLYFIILNCFLRDNKKLSYIFIVREKKIQFKTPAKVSSDILKIAMKCGGKNISGKKTGDFYCFSRRINSESFLVFLSVKRQIEKGVRSVKFFSFLAVIIVALIVLIIHNFVFKYVSKNMDQKIKETEDKFKKLIENNPAGVLIIEEGKIVYANPTAVRMLGAKSENEILGKPPVEFVEDKYREKSLRRLKAFEGGAKELPPVKGELKRLDGSRLWIETRSLLIEYDGKKAIQSIMWDISELKSAEDELLKTKKHLEDLYNSANMMIFSLDKKYCYLSFNQLYKEIVKQNWGVEIKNGMNILKIISNYEDRKKAKENFDRALSGESFIKVEEFSGKNFRRRYYENIYSPLKGNRGEIEGLIVFVRDVTERINIEREIRRLSRVVETSQQGIVIFDLDFKIVYANKKALEIVNWNQNEDISGREVFDFISKENFYFFYERIIPLLRKGKTWRGEISMYGKEGVLIPAEVHASAVVSGEGEIENFVVIFSDISQRKRAEVALKEAYEFTKTIFSSIPAAIFSKDREGRYLLVNEEFASYAGMTPDEMRGKTVQECWPENVSLIYKDKDLELIEADGEQIYEYYLPHKERGKVPGIFHKACFHDAEGKVAGLVGVFMDLSELKKTQAALKESEERSRAILEALPDIIFTLDEEGRFLSYHTPSEKVSLLAQEHFIGKKIEEVLSDELAGKTKKAMKIVKDSGETYVYEYNLISEYETKWFEARMVKKGKKEFLVIVRDVTENKKLERRLIQAQKMETVGTLAGGIAHDFNNILTIINGYCEIGLRKIKESKGVFNEIRAIYDASQRAIKLVSQLLAFSRKQLISPKVLNLNELISNLYSMLKRLISEDIHLELHLNKENLKIKMDPSQIEQILVNLVVNAKDAIEEKGKEVKEKKITIETGKVFIDSEYVREHPGSWEGEFVMFSVSDTGIGMSKEVREKVFEPFFTTKEVGKGTGLGLSTVYGIVKQNNGFIYIYSEEGEGTSVKVYFPLTKGKDKEKLKEEDEKVVAKDGKGEVILIVEDSRDVRSFLRDALKTLGYRVIESEDGKEALKIFRQRKDEINLVITDLIMPKMNGKELADKIIKIKKDIKIIYTSGYTENHIAHRGIIDKGVTLLQKPYSLNELSEKIKKVLG